MNVMSISISFNAKMLNLLSDQICPAGPVLLQFPHFFNIKANMDIMYKDTISAQIHGEEWKINMILEIVNCLNELCENDFTYDENMFLLSDICIT